MTRDLTSWRAEFPLLQDPGRVYFLNNALGAAPKGLAAWLARYAEEQFTLGDRGWQVWWPFVLAHADRVAKLIGAPAGSVVMEVGVTAGVHRVASALDFTGPRRRVVVSQLDFPSINYAWQAWERHGAEIVVVPSPDGIHVDEEAVIAAIDERTAIVSLSLATYCSGALVDTARVGTAARKMGALLLVDAFQAFGIVPIDVVALQADILISGSRKFGMGAGDSAFIYVRPELIATLEPLLVGWFAHREPFAFARPFERAPNIHRFHGGTPAVLPHYAATPGLEVIEAVGIAAIRARSLALTGRIIDQADAQGLSVATPRPDGQRAGVVCLKFPGDEATAASLARDGFGCSYRPASGLRLGPHFFNTDDEVDRFMTHLATLRQAGVAT